MASQGAGAGAGAGAGETPRSAVPDVEILRGDAVPALLRGVGVEEVSQADMDQVDQEGMSTQRAKAARFQHSLVQTRKLDEERAEARKRGIRVSDKLPWYSFCDAMPGIKPCTHVVATFASFAQAPLVQDRQPRFRVLAATTQGHEAAVRARLALEAYRSPGAQLRLPGEPRVVPTLQWTAVMASPEEQADEALVRRHVAAVMERHRWYMKARAVIMQRVEEGKLGNFSMGSLFSVMEFPPCEETPTGKLLKKLALPVGLGKKGMERYWMKRRAMAIVAEEKAVAERRKQRKQWQAAVDACRAQREGRDGAAATGTGVAAAGAAAAAAGAAAAASTIASLDHPEAEIRAKLAAEAAAAKKRGTVGLDDPVPTALRGKAAEAKVFMMTALPDMTLHEHLWLDAMNGACADLLGTALPRLAPVRVFEDDIPRPLILVFPHLTTPGTEELQRYIAALQRQVQDVEILELPPGTWVQPQTPCTTDAEAVYHTELQSEVLGRSRAQQRQRMAEYRKGCDDLGIDCAAITIGNAEGIGSASLEMATLREKMAPWEGVGGCLSRKQRRALRRARAKAKNTLVPKIPLPKNDAERMSVRDAATGAPTFTNYAAVALERAGVLAASSAPGGALPPQRQVPDPPLMQRA
jgi:hypothetical protein